MLGEHRLLTGTAGVCSWLKNSKKKELNKYIPIPGFEPGSTDPRRARWKRVRPGCVPNYTSLDFSFWTSVHISSKYYIQKHAGSVLKCPRGSQFWLLKQRTNQNWGFRPGLTSPFSPQSVARGVTRIWSKGWRGLGWELGLSEKRVPLFSAKWDIKSPAEEKRLSRRERNRPSVVCEN
jgi:hypothetical protein